MKKIILSLTLFSTLTGQIFCTIEETCKKVFGVEDKELISSIQKLNSVFEELEGFLKRSEEVLGKLKSINIETIASFEEKNKEVFYKYTSLYKQAKANYKRTKALADEYDSKNTILKPYLEEKSFILEKVKTMKKAISSLTTCGTIATQFFCNAEEPLKIGESYDLLSGPFAGQKITVNEICEDAFGVKSVVELLEKKPEFIRTPAIINYLRNISQNFHDEDSLFDINNIPEKYRGAFYYGQTEYTRNTTIYGRRICLHPSWLEESVGPDEWVEKRADYDEELKASIKNQNDAMSKLEFAQKHLAKLVEIKKLLEITRNHLDSDNKEIDYVIKEFQTTSDIITTTYAHASDAYKNTKVIFDERHPANEGLKTYLEQNNSILEEFKAALDQVVIVPELTNAS